MADSRAQLTADCLAANGIRPEAIVSYLEQQAIAGGVEASGRVVVGDTAYEWAEDVVRPHLYEFDRASEREMARRPARVGERRKTGRAKTWRMLHRAHFRSKRKSRGVNTDHIGAPDGSGGEPPATG